jgi:hypothetical protein
MTSGGTIKGLSPNLEAWIRDVGRSRRGTRRMLITMRLGVRFQGGRLAAHKVVLIRTGLGGLSQQGYKALI